MGLKDFYVDLAKHVMIEDLDIKPLIIESAENLIKNYPDNPRAWSFAGGVYLDEVYDTVKAIEYYNKTLEVYPNYIMALQNLTDIYTFQHEFDLADEKLNQALEVNPDFGQLAWSIRDLYQESGRISEADDFFTGIIDEYNLSDVYFFRTLADVYLN